jgi:hypothetical protein
MVSRHGIQEWILGEQAHPELLSNLVDELKVRRLTGTSGIGGLWDRRLNVRPGTAIVPATISG